MRAWRRVVTAVAVLAATGVVAVPAASATPGRRADDALTQLAERFAPVVFLQHQDEPCGAGEPYAPFPVEQVLGQPDVVLRGADGEVLVTGPTADDLAAAPEGSNLDFPGDAGDPHCDFEQRFGRRTATLPVTQYARLAVDPERPGQFAIQYWWWFVYNDWNDIHEGDWEMGQVVFDADTPEDALARGLAPTTMALSQHNGTEVRPWANVPREGDRPLVFPAAGSHAGYYSQHRWFGTNGEAGFGCDDTRGPSDRVDPLVVVLPDQVTPGDGFGWMVFPGYWGQREPALNDSETGPQTTTQWQEPIRWMEDSGRDAAVQVPEVGGVTAFFCLAAAKGSDVLNAVLHQPLLAGGLLAVLVIAVVVLARRTSWRPAVATPLVRARAAGQILTSAWRRLRTERRRFVPIAVFVFAGAIAAAFLQRLIVGWSPVHTMAEVVGRETPAGQILALVVGLAVTVPVTVIALAWAVDVADRAAGDPLDAAISRRVWRRGLIVPCALLVVTVVLGWIVLPLGGYLLARWLVAPAVAAADGAGARTALRASAEMTRGRRWRTFFIGALVVAVVLLLGVLAGTFALILTSASFAFVNVAAGLIRALLVPWMGIVVAMTYGDLRARREGSGP